MKIEQIIVFLQKEFIEGFRTKKALILLLVSALFGFLGPVTAKLIPRLLEVLETGFEINIPEPTQLDAWAQFTKNLYGTLFFVIIIIFSNIVSWEIEKKTLVNLLSKGLNRSTIIIAKYLNMIIMLTLSISLMFIISYIYTIVLFGESSFIRPVITLGYMLFDYYLLASIIILGSTAFSKYFGGLILPLVILGINGILSYLSEKYQEISPFNLGDSANLIYDETLGITEFTDNLILAIIMIIINITITVIIFNKKQVT